jgi:hypothetical protein
MPYEIGMSIQYEHDTGKVIIHFRGKRIILRGPYPTREAGTKAGEEFCRRQGWSR